MECDQNVSLGSLDNDILLVIISWVKTNTTKEDDAGITLWRTPILPLNKQLSALQCVSMTDRRLRSLSITLLFRSIAIQGDWSKVLRGLTVVQDCPAILNTVRSFNFDVSTTAAGNISNAPSDIAVRLATALMRMPKLRRLTLREPGHHASEFETAFNSNNVYLPKVKEVVVGTFYEFVIPRCPNVESVSSEASKRRGYAPGQGSTERTQCFIEAAGHAKGLKSFELTRIWKRGQLQPILENMPNLQKLSMPGMFLTPLREQAVIIRQFKALERLVLPRISELREGSHGCTLGVTPRSFHGPAGRERRKREAERHRRAEHVVATMLFQECNSLSTLWVGELSRADVERDERGYVQSIKWTYKE